jgi:hypothetical protein
MRRRLALVALAALAPLVLAACDRNDISTIERPYDAVVLTGAQVPSLVGAPPSRIVAFRFVYGTWRQVPVQVDERAFLDLATPYNQPPVGKTARFYTDANTWTGADPDPNLDADDEIAFMAKDAFGKARSIDDDQNDVHYTLANPPGVVAGSGVEVRLHDPLDANAAAWVYLFRSDGTLDPAAGRAPIGYQFALQSGNYKQTYDLGAGPNPENSRVTTSAYSLHFPDRWKVDQLDVTVGNATGTDILDGHKSGFAGTCVRSETTFSTGEGAMVANKTGPVRAIRSYLGANSGPYTQRDHLMYAQRADFTTYLRVHAIPPLRDWLDYSAAAIGMTFSASNVAGVTIDGQPDTVPTAQPTWQMVTGAPGTVVNTARLDTTIAAVTQNVQQYYSDTTSPSEPQCSGDAVQYGASGLTLNANVPCTDPTMNCTDSLTSTRRMTFLGPNTAAATAQKIGAQDAAPLTATVAGFNP